MLTTRDEATSPLLVSTRDNNDSSHDSMHAVAAGGSGLVITPRRGAVMPKDSVALAIPELDGAITLQNFPPKVAAAIERAHRQSCSTLPSNAGLTARIALSAVYAAIGYFTFRASALYAGDGVTKMLDTLFGTSYEVSGATDLILSAGTMIPAIMLSTRSFLRISDQAVRNWQSALTLGSIRRAEFHETRWEFIVDIAGASIFVVVPAISASCTAYAVFHRLHELSDRGTGQPFISSEQVADLYAYAAQLSASTTNGLLAKEVFVEPTTEWFASFLKRHLSGSQAKRATFRAILNDLKSRIAHPETLATPKKQSILRLYEHLRGLNDPLQGAQFPNKLKELILYWNREFRAEITDQDFQVYGKDRNALFDRSSIMNLITLPMGAIFSVPYLVAGSKAADFAERVSFFGLFHVPGEIIGASSFFANLVINTASINALFTDLAELMDKTRKSDRSLADKVRIICSLLVNLLYLFGQVGLAYSFPLFKNIAWEITQLFVTVFAAYGLGAFAFNNAALDIINYFRRFGARGQLNGQLRAYYENVLDQQYQTQLDQLASLTAREIASMIELLDIQLRNLPTNVMEELFNVVETSISHAQPAPSGQPAVPSSTQPLESDEEAGVTNEQSGLLQQDSLPATARRTSGYGTMTTIQTDERVLTMADGNATNPLTFFADRAREQNPRLRTRLGQPH